MELFPTFGDAGSVARVILWIEQVLMENGSGSKVATTLGSVGKN
jgi:hypothetical protein